MDAGGAEDTMLLIGFCSELWDLTFSRFPLAENRLSGLTSVDGVWFTQEESWRKKNLNEQTHSLNDLWLSIKSEVDIGFITAAF